MSTNRDQIDNESRSSLHNSRGIDLAERGWLDEAIKEFKNAIKSAPSCAQGYDNLGTAYADKGDVLSAMSSYAKAISLEPENPIALHNLGCFISNHGSSLAFKCFKMAFKNDPELYEARFNMGLCFASEEKHEQAIAHFEDALLQNDQDIDVRFQLALSLVALEKHAKAIKELLVVVKTNKNHDQAFFNLGVCYQEQGFLEEAINAFSKAILLNPHNVEGILWLSSLLVRMNRHKEAKALTKRAMNLDPKRAKDLIAQDPYLCTDSQPKVKRHK